MNKRLSIIMFLLSVVLAFLLVWKNRNVVKCETDIVSFPDERLQHGKDALECFQALMNNEMDKVASGFSLLFQRELTVQKLNTNHTEKTGQILSLEILHVVSNMASDPQPYDSKVDRPTFEFLLAVRNAWPEIITYSKYNQGGFLLDFINQKIAISNDSHLLKNEHETRSSAMPDKGTWEESPCK